MVWKPKEKSLINLNQCQKFVMQIYDDPNDPHRKLVIKSSEDLFIPMAMEVSNCVIITHPPTKNNIHEYQLILLSHEFDWYPSNILFGIYSLVEEYRTTSNFHPHINLIESIIIFVPPTIHCRENSGICEFNKAI